MIFDSPLQVSWVGHFVLSPQECDTGADPSGKNGNPEADQARVALHQCHLSQQGTDLVSSVRGEELKPLRVAAGLIR